MMKGQYETILYVDMTPTEDLPIRILETYKKDCEITRDGFSMMKEIKDPMLMIVIEYNLKRIEILNKAIKELKERGTNGKRNKQKT